jgi:hypothetical protein
MAYKMQVAGLPSGRMLLVVVLLGMLIVAPVKTVTALGIAGTITRPGFLPSALALDGAMNRLFVFDESTHSVFIYNATTLQELGSVETTLGDCLSMVVDESQGKLYAAYFGPGAGLSDNIAVIDTHTGTLLKYVQSSGFGFLVNDEALDVVYASSNSSVQRIDVATDMATSIDGIWGNIYTSMAVNPVTHELFVSNWSQNDGKLFIVNPTTLAITPVANMAGFGVAVNWNDNKAYVSYCISAGFEGLCIYNRDSGTITRTYTANDSTRPLAFNPLVDRLYSDTEVNHVTTIVTGATDVYSNVTVVSALTSVGVRYSTDAVYLTGMYGTYVMNGADGAIVTQFPAPEPQCSFCNSAMVINQTTGRVYVVPETTNGYVSVIQDGVPVLSPVVFIPVVYR